MLTSNEEENGEKKNKWQKSALPRKKFLPAESLHPTLLQSGSQPLPLWDLLMGQVLLEQAQDFLSHITALI